MHEHSMCDIWDEDSVGGMAMGRTLANSKERGSGGLCAHATQSAFSTLCPSTPAYLYILSLQWNLEVFKERGHSLLVLVVSAFSLE